MSEIELKTILVGKIAQRASVLFAEQQNAVYRRTDSLFGTLLILQWLAGILVAVIVSPRAWTGSHSDVHIHVWTAIFLGGLIISFPVYLAYRRPGAALTRHSIAVGQMLSVALLIHLTGGRIETHFQIFGSLAFLSFYRDWRVLISASLVVVIDHIFRGYYFPLSIYGVNGIEPWRWLEHSWWVIFEDVFLIRSCFENIKEMKAIACRQAEVEETRDNIEVLVKVRTSELLASEHKLATQYAFTRNLTEATTLVGAAPKIMEAIVKGLLPQTRVAASVMWTVNKMSGQFEKIGQLKYSADLDTPLSQLTDDEANRLSHLGLVNMAKDKASLLQLEKMEQETTIADPDTGLALGLTSALALPLLEEDQVYGVIEFFAEKPIQLADSEVSMLESLGQQVGAFAVKMQIEAENRQLANMVHWSGDAIVGQTADGIITSWNRGAQALFGYRAEEISGQHISVLVPPDKLHELEQIIAMNQGGNIVEGHETQRLTKSGKTVEVSITRSPVFDERQRLVGFSAVIHDITERTEAARRVGEFYSIVSHELRTPLTSVRGVLGLIEGGAVEAGSAEAAELLTVARESTDRLIRLINDMLDLKKIESGKMDLNFTPVPVSKLVGDCLDGLTGMSESSTVKLQHSFGYKGQVFADFDKATQILTNLVSNAIKFSPPGSIIKVVVETSANSMVRFKVIDNGPGISLGDQGKLFQKFQQLDSSDTRQKGGTGLGLAICKALVEEHKGSLGLESTLGQGSTFWFELPKMEAAAASASDMPEQLQVPQENKRVISSDAANWIKTDRKQNGQLPRNNILLVEDDAHLVRVLTAHFIHTGYRTVVAPSLKEARKCLSLTRFDVVVLNLGLPDGSGLDLLEEIKSNQNTASLPVIVITGQVIDDKYLVNATVADWLAKPFHSSAPIKVIDRLTAKSDLQAVLVTDRDHLALKELGSQLKALGMRCMEARDGHEALAFGKELRPDLIILDVTIPNQNALEELKILRRRDTSDRSHYSPLVIFSNKDLSPEERKELNLRTTNQLIQNESGKPELIDAVSTLLNGICR